MWASKKSYDWFNCCHDFGVAAVVMVPESGQYGVLGPSTRLMQRSLASFIFDAVKSCLGVLWFLLHCFADTLLAIWVLRPQGFPSAGRIPDVSCAQLVMGISCNNSIRAAFMTMVVGINIRSESILATNP